MLIRVGTGGDYNLAEAEPGDLDPHAVSSIFKTFLRECGWRMLLCSELHGLMMTCSARACLDYGDASLLRVSTGGRTW